MRSITLVDILCILGASLAVILSAMTQKNAQTELANCKQKLSETQGDLGAHKELLKVPKHNANVTAQKILKLQPNLEEGTAFWYGFIVNEECPNELHSILISILFAESSFDHLKKNGTGDYGLGQINHRVWGKFFGVSRSELLNPIVNIRIASTILQMAKVSHGEKPDWYAYYHSWNRIPRQLYKEKIDKILAEINTCASKTCERKP